MVNNCRKGKVVERALAHWFRERGIASARRTQQYQGNSEDDASDLNVEKELPSFHIECKGTQSAKLEKGKLKKWIAQVRKDCPPTKVPVILNKANSKNWVAILLPETIEKFRFIAELPSFQPAHQESFVPTEYFEAWNDVKTLAKLKAPGMGQYSAGNANFLLFLIDEELYVGALDAEEWLNLAKIYESKSNVPV